MAGDTWHIMIIIIWMPRCYLGSGEVALKSMWKTGAIAFPGCCVRKYRPLFICIGLITGNSALSRCQNKHSGGIWCSNGEVQRRTFKHFCAQFYSNNLILSLFNLLKSRFDSQTRPCNHLESKPMSLNISIWRWRLPSRQSHCRLVVTLKLSNASFTVLINSCFWLQMLP